MTKTLALAPALLFALSCGGSSGNPTVVIVSPQSGASVALGTDPAKSVPVSFTLTDFTLKEPGRCGGAANCGHIHLVIDDASSPCNNVQGNGSDRYNLQIISGTTANAQLASCGAGAAGTHSITLELADDAHNVLAGSGVKSTVSNVVTH